METSPPTSPGCQLRRHQFLESHLFSLRQLGLPRCPRCIIFGYIGRRLGGDRWTLTHCSRFGGSLSSGGSNRLCGSQGVGGRRRARSSPPCRFTKPGVGPANVILGRAPGHRLSGASHHLGNGAGVQSLASGQAFRLFPSKPGVTQWLQGKTDGKKPKEQRGHNPKNNPDPKPNTGCRRVSGHHSMF